MATIKRAIATLSWIDPKSGLPEVDYAGEPGREIDKETVVGKEAYRFANFLNVTVTAEKDKILSHCIEPDSGMYRRPSWLNIESHPVGQIGQYSVSLGRSVVFRQLVGCRTVAPEKVGEAVGFLLGCRLGRRLGRQWAASVLTFPPIWTEIEMTVNADGTWSQQLVRHSLFPSVSFYVINAKSEFTRTGASYDGVPSLKIWQTRGWGAVMPSTGGPTAGNPWGLTAPTASAGSRIEHIPVSTGPYCVGQ